MADQDEIDWIKENEPWRLEKSEVKEELKVVEVDWNYKLVKIKGIGEQIAKDLGNIYDTEEDLIKALNEDKVPIRNDKVLLLRGYYDRTDK